MLLDNNCKSKKILSIVSCILLLKGTWIERIQY